MGVGLVLHRLSHHSGMILVQWAFRVSMAVVGLASLAVGLLFALQCRPLSVAWGEGEGTCISTETIAISAMVLSVVVMTVRWLYAVSHLLGQPGDSVTNA